MISRDDSEFFIPFDNSLVGVILGLEFDVAEYPTWRHQLDDFVRLPWGQRPISVELGSGLINDQQISLAFLRSANGYLTVEPTAARIIANRTTEIEFPRFIERFRRRKNQSSE